MAGSPLDGVILVARPEARAALESWLEGAGTLSAAARSSPGVRTLRGRGPVYVVPAPGATDGVNWAVRPYRRGGLAARLSGTRYLRVGVPRPIREYRLVRALEELGIPTARPIGAAVYRSGPVYTGDLVTEYVPDSVDLAAVLFPDSDVAPPAASPRAAMAAAGALVRRLHGAGVVHPDLNLKNFLVTGAGDTAEARILDLDRGRLRRTVGRGARRRMLDRFRRSLARWEARTGRRLAPEVRAAFEAGYGAD